MVTRKFTYDAETSIAQFFDDDQFLVVQNITFEKANEIARFLDRARDNENARTKGGVRKALEDFAQNL